MMSRLVKFPALFAVLPAIRMDYKNFDVVGEKYLTGRQPGEDSEDSWERVKRMFGTDDYGRMSSELNSIYQAGFLGGFAGAVYGGFLGSRKAYFDFMDRNQATAFENHMDAKRKLQNSVTVSFGKNAFRFGWRLALFSITYTALTTTIAVYRGKSSMVEYLSAGVTTGALYKFNMGLRGMAAGGIVGGVLGGIGGGISLLILKSTGMTMEEVRFWQYKWRSGRDENIQAVMKKSLEGTEEQDVQMEKHDERLGGTKLDLRILDMYDNKDHILKAAAKENEAIMEATAKETQKGTVKN